MVLIHLPGRLSEASLRLLQEVGWKTCEVERIPYPENRPPAHNFMDNYTKLRLFEYVLSVHSSLL